ncbi:MAG TPA: response regulator [Candidatus Dormibacteraeota bacterium]|nr:response regulator [Candidatus Dormibacteraeota bacterium]
MAHTVLLVDDDPQLTHVVSMFFEIEGYAVLVARGGRQALDILTQTRPDIVLLDLMMPDVDGLEVCRQIRADPRMKDLPVAVFTAAEMRQEELMGAGADSFIVKPYSLDGLKKVVEELIASPAGA